MLRLPGDLALASMPEAYFCRERFAAYKPRAPMAKNKVHAGSGTGDVLIDNCKTEMPGTESPPK